MSMWMDMRKPRFGYTGSWCEESRAAVDAFASQGTSDCADNETQGG